MAPSSTIFAVAVSLFASLPIISASPIDSISNLQCHCITFTAGSTEPCDIPDTENLTWHAARDVASYYRLPIQFASEETVSQILDADAPLPTSILLRMNDGTPVPSRDATTKYSDQWIVCESNEATEYEQAEKWSSMNPCDVFVLQLIVLLILFIVLYEAAEYVWTRRFRRRRHTSARNGNIQLSGEEKALSAYYNAEPWLSPKEKADDPPKTPLFVRQLRGHLSPDLSK